MTKEDKIILKKMISEYFADYHTTLNKNFLMAWGEELKRFCVDGLRVAFTYARAKSPKLMMSAYDIASIAQEIRTEAWEKKKRRTAKKPKTYTPLSDDTRRKCVLEFMRGANTQRKKKGKPFMTLTEAIEEMRGFSSDVVGDTTSLFKKQLMD